MKNTHHAFHALNAPTRVTGYVDRPPHRPRLAAVCRGLTAHRPPWPTVIVRWFGRVRQRRNMHTAALSSVLRVSARAKPRTEWLGWARASGSWWVYEGEKMCSKCQLQSSHAMALGLQSSRKTGSGTSQRVAAAQKYHPPHRSRRRHSQIRLVNQLAPASGGVRRRPAVRYIERGALYITHAWST